VAHSFNLEAALVQDMVGFYADPLGFVMYAYPWDSDRELQVVKLPEPWRTIYGCDYGPDGWACEFLEELGREVKKRNFDGVHAVDAIQMARASGHGIGKSALVAWLVDWIMSTRPHCQGTVTANTSTQLSTKTWAQIVKWTQKCITRHWFEIATGRGSMMMKHKQYPSSWFCSAQTCDKENSQAFAGQHAATSTSFYINDESSEIPDEIEEVQKGGLTDGEPMRFSFGNPTQNTGWFHAAIIGAQRHRWLSGQIDSRDVQITNKKFLQELIDDYGIDSDIVKIRVRGMFPSMAAKQFISTVDVDAATHRHLRVEQYNFAPKILTLDNAWEGDDEGVIGLRQGLKYQTLRYYAKNDNDIEIANTLARLEDEHEADAVFIDAGYGTGVYSAGITMGRDWQLFWFSGESPDPGCLNFRSYIWNEVKKWLKSGGAIDEKDRVLYADLTSIWTVPRIDGKIQLEAKKDMKRRLLPSPGRGDALALSFCLPMVEKKPRTPLEALAAQIGTGHLDHGNRGHDPYTLER
jgi:hypothetical protein